MRVYHTANMLFLESAVSVFPEYASTLNVIQRTGSKGNPVRRILVATVNGQETELAFSDDYPTHNGELGAGNAAL